MYYSGNSHIVDAQLFYFTHTHTRAITNIDPINSNMHRNECNLVKVFALEQAFLKSTNPSCFCAPL